jgi:hypothetical protein
MHARSCAECTAGVLHMHYRRRALNALLPTVHSVKGIAGCRALWWTKERNVAAFILAVLIRNLQAGSAVGFFGYTWAHTDANKRLHCASAGDHVQIQC